MPKLREANSLEKQCVADLISVYSVRASLLNMSPPVDVAPELVLSIFLNAKTHNLERQTVALGEKTVKLEEKTVDLTERITKQRDDRRFMDATTLSLLLIIVVFLGLRYLQNAPI